MLGGFVHDSSLRRGSRHKPALGLVSLSPLLGTLVPAALLC